DSSDLARTTTTSAGAGAWSFSNLPAGKFIVQVKRSDAPTGDQLSSVETYAVTLGPSVANLKFGFTPTLPVGKTVIGSGEVTAVGELVSYNLTVTDLLKPAGLVPLSTETDVYWTDATANNSFHFIPTTSTTQTDVALGGATASPLDLAFDMTNGK